LAARASALSLHDALPIYDDEGVDLVLEGRDADLGLGLAALALEAEGLRDDTDRESADRLGDACDDGRATRAGTPAFARGYEDHVDRKSTRLNSSHVKTSY